MTAQTILASNKPISIVLEVRTDNTKVMPAAYSDWVGGNSLLALPLGVEFEDNSLVYLSTGAVAGLTYNEVVFGDFFVERSLAAPFTGGGGLSTNGLPNAPSFAGLDIFVSGDDLELYARDWENKPFTLYVGYEGDDWANFEVYITGKTIGHSLINNGIQVDLSINPTGTDKLFPVNRFDDGRVKPYLFGRGFKIKPVPVNAGAGDGLWMFHNGTSGTTATSYTTPPIIHLDASESIAVGRISYIIFANSGVDSGNSPATNAFPADLTVGDGSIANEGDYIQITVPDKVTSADNARISFSVETPDGELIGKSVKYKALLSLDAASTVDSFDIKLSPFYNPLSPPFDDLTVTITKTPTQIESGFYSYISSLVDLVLIAQKGAGQSAKDIIVNVHRVSFEPRIQGQDFRVFTNADKGYQPIRTLRVTDATASPSLPNGIAVFDSAGYLKLANDNTDFVVNALGDTTNNDLVAACQYISTQANGTDSPITSSIASPSVGVYCDKAKPVFRWLQDLCDPLDIYLDVSQTTSTIDLKRRFNGTVFDADGTLNVIDAFSFTEDDIANLKQLPNEPSVSKYEVSYNYNHASPNESPTVTNINPFARLNQVERIDTPLVSSVGATVVAELNNRDGNRRTFYEFEITGAGHGLSPNDTGKISHSRIKDGGLFTIRFVREYPLQKKTLIKGVKHG